MKQFKQLKKKGQTLERVAPVEKVKHIIFLGMGDDNITIPLCGEIQGQIIATKAIRRVNCRACLEVAKSLANFDDHPQALAHVTGRMKPVLVPDKKIARKKDGQGNPTKEARKHILAQEFLVYKKAETVADLPANIIGTTPETFFLNMVDLKLICDDDDLTDDVGEPIPGLDLGDPNPQTIELIEEQLLGLE